MRRQEEMEKRLQMDMQRKLRERQERLNREQAELQERLEKQRERIREAEEKAEREDMDITSSYVVSTDKKDVTVPNKESKETPSAPAARAEETVVRQRSQQRVSATCCQGCTRRGNNEYSLQDGDY